MSKTFYFKLFGPATLSAGLALNLVVLTAQAVLPPVVNPNPTHQSIEANSAPTLTWSRDRVELLVNGGFELGDVNTGAIEGWNAQTLQGFGGVEYDQGEFNPNGPDGPTPPLDGIASATLQAINFQGGGMYELSQQVTIPAGLGDVTLTWSHLIRNYANAFSNDQPSQFYRLEVRNLGGAVLDTLFTTNPGDPVVDVNNLDIVAYFDWQKRRVNMDAYVGQTIQLVFFFSSQLGNLNVRLDRMSLTGRPGNPVSNEVYLSLTPSPGVSDLQGTTTANAWSLVNLQPSTTYYWRVDSRQGGEFLAGPVWRFRTQSPGNLDYFSWNAPDIASANTPFPVTVNGKDAAANQVTGAGVTGTADLSAVTLNTASKFNILSAQPFTSFNSFENTTVGYSFTPSTDIWVESLRSLSGDRVSIWTKDGLMLARAPLSGSNGAWKESALATPLSLLAGRTYRIGAHSGDATPYYNRFDANSNFAHGSIDQSYTGLGDVFPNQSHPAQWWMVGFQYIVAQPLPLTVSPSTTGDFINGSWSDSVSVPQASGLTVLRVEHSSGTRGYSNPITFDASTNNDRDNDQIPNDWETDHQLNPDDPSDADLDGDGDGFTNLEEYWTGTDPNDSSSLLRVESINKTGEQVFLQFTAQANRSYSVLYTESIGGTGWNKLADLEEEPEARISTIIDTAPLSENRFYQVVSPKQP